jgi:hypothetical protein
MKTQTIELDDATATALRQRAEERGVSVPELLAELLVLETVQLGRATTRSPNWAAAGTHSRPRSLSSPMMTWCGWLAQDLANRERNIGKSSSRFSAPNTYFSSTSMESD